MKALVIAVFSMVGSAPVTTTMPANECKPAMEQVVKSYGMTSYIKSWSNSSIKAEKGPTKLVVTCNAIT
jgi:hypothetical protein